VCQYYVQVLMTVFPVSSVKSSLISTLAWMLVHVYQFWRLSYLCCCWELIWYGIGHYQLTSCLWM